MQIIDGNLRILIGVAIIFAIGISAWGIKIQSEIEDLASASTSQIVPFSPRVFLVIDNGTGDRQAFQMEVDRETTVFDLLKKTGLTLTYTEYDIGIFINAIGDVSNNEKESKYWMYYINGELADLGVGAQIVKPGDKVEFKFEKANW